MNSNDITKRIIHVEDRMLQIKSDLYDLKSVLREISIEKLNAFLEASLNNWNRLPASLFNGTVVSRGSFELNGEDLAKKYAATLTILSNFIIYPIVTIFFDQNAGKINKLRFSIEGINSSTRSRLVTIYDAEACIDEEIGKVIVKCHKSNITLSEVYDMLGAITSLAELLVNSFLLQSLETRSFGNKTK